MTEDPFTILEIDETATKKDIMLVVTKALRAGRYEAKTIAAAQKTLFNPTARAQAEFRYRVDFRPYAVAVPQAPAQESPQLVRLILPQV
uniref:Uncharacterized protein n=1 Tax=Candidatus Kentrum sp. FM TaxID=2126340 RepID=A0A450TMA3_9GAMM|nr:MAG: hypothetical protein BECKFM1743C_GA0114222_104843 [Candidatus Kentron sp. FM]VFJ68853.1 MAG: hypothetical protein BECKFM1743A_GA0114220_104863 [Candidatus Kentron sp. FM]VFK16797.1 MAG: hypothetical protein BECKFM1743B_GA0114221_104444 [Candidatus Kentron sp. FM]